MSYMEDTGNLFDEISKRATDNNHTVDHVFELAEKIHGISDEVRQTGLFQDSTERSEEYKKFLSNKHPELKDQIWYAWNDFVIKVTGAPTRVHVRGAVILLVPIISELIKKQVENTTKISPNLGIDNE